MSGRRIIESMKEAIAISRGELATTSYNIHIPEKVNVKASFTALLPFLPL
jgi:hypothetical protein